MARGFESKSVEQQQQDAEERRSTAKRVKLSADQIEADRKREGLLLQRTRILREIESSSSPRHRETLRGGLKYLESQLKAAGWKPAR
jgi:hypothetical protein